MVFAPSVSGIWFVGNPLWNFNHVVTNCQLKAGLNLKMSTRQKNKNERYIDYKIISRNCVCVTIFFYIIGGIIFVDLSQFRENIFAVNTSISPYSKPKYWHNFKEGKEKMKLTINNTHNENLKRIQFEVKGTEKLVLITV